MLIEGGSHSTSEVDPESILAAGVLSVSQDETALKPKWLTKIAKNRQRVSKLMQKMFVEEAICDRHFLTPPNEFSPPYMILDRLQTHQKKLLHEISNLIIPTVPAGMMEEIQITPNENKFPLFPWLREKGYLALAEKLEQETGYPWDEFKKIRSPILIEQLVDIYLLCIHKKIKIEETEKIIRFTLYLANWATSTHLREEYSQSYEVINDTKQILGQFIYLLNQDPSFALKTLNEEHYEVVLNNIKDAFSNHIPEICERLQNHYSAHYATQLQDPEIALHMRIPIEIAKALLTDIGTINIGIIDSLSDIFLSPDNTPINHDINLMHALTLLQRSPKLRAEFEKISSPHSSLNPSTNIIREVLELSPDEIIGPLDGRLTALIAILSHLRQGGDRSCFAVSLAIEILSSHLGYCFKDLRQLLEEGKLTRRVGKIKKDIPFVKRISDKDLHKIITFNEEGKLMINDQREAYLWESPGLLGACRSIGVADPKTTLLAVIQNLPRPEEGKSYTIEIKGLIAKICEQLRSESFDLAELDQLYNQACFAFSSQTTQPLLKVWENSIANMAEAQEGSMIKTAILESILDSLQFKLGQLAIPPSLLLQRFFLCTQQLLHDGIQLQYDPIVQGFEEGNHSSNEGGFVLYYNNERIGDVAAFRLFVRNILEETNQHLLRRFSFSDLENMQLRNALDVLISHLNSEEFIGYLLSRYHPSNKIAVGQSSHAHPIVYNHLRYTPWLTQTGNDSKALLKIYLESDTPIQSEKFIVSGAEEALTKIIEMCKHMSEDEKKLYLNNPNKLKPLCILGKHRLPFMAGNSSLSSAWKQECSTQSWIENVVLNPGKKIADTIIDPLSKQNFIGYLEKILPYDLSNEAKQHISNQLRERQDDLTIKEYRNSVLALCLSMHTFSKGAAEVLTRHIDTALCNSLVPELKKILEESAVHFADTNWCEGIQDLHLCFAVNPGTGKLELWEVQSNGTHLTALDQNYWLYNQKWEFLTMPEDLIADDSSYLDIH